jgi:hypothetical protein
MWGAAVGTAGGLVTGSFGEFLVQIVRWLFPTDVWFLGIVLLWAVPLRIATGAICGWRQWLINPYRRAAIAGVPGLIFGVLVAILQFDAY